MASHQPQVFISYQRTDSGIARRVREHLVAHGVRTWMDQHDIPVGAYWPDEIDKGLAASDFVVGVLSPDAAASRNVKNEWDWAIAHQRPLLLLQVQPSDIPHRYISINFIDATDDIDAALRRLTAVLGRPETMVGLPLAGASVPVHTRPVSAEAPAAVAPAAVAERDDPFVGRERELGEATTVLEAALAGRRQLLLLAGEPGIGKTRLAEQVTRAAARRGAATFWGRCYEWEGAPAYWPWVEVLRAHAEATDVLELRRQIGAGAPFVAQIVPELSALLGQLPELPPMSPEQARFRLFDSIARFVQHAAAVRALVVVLDDLHWADEASLLLLEFVARELPRSPLLLIGTYRDVEVRRNHPLARSLASLTRAAEPRRIALKGIPRDAVADYIRLTAGSQPDEALVDAVHAETEGNPFYVGEVVRLLQAEGQLDAPDGRWDRAIPESVRAVVGRRLDRLSPSCNDLLKLAAVVGREFGVGLLATIRGATPEALLDLLDEAVEARVVDETSAFGRYRFAHALIQHTLYEELSTSQRVRLHGQVGRALEEMHAVGLAAHYSDLAHHFGQAPLGANLRKAVDYAVLAGERATEQLAWETALQHYGQALQALDLLEPPDDRRRCEVLIAIGNIQTLSLIERDEPFETYRRAAGIALRIGDAELLARAALTSDYYALTPWGVDESWRALLEAALARLGPNDSPLRSRVLARLAVALYFDADRADERAALTAEAIAMARRLSDQAALSYSLAARRAAGLRTEQLAERVEASMENIRVGEAIGDWVLAAWGYDYLPGDLLETGRVDDARRQSETLLREATERRQPEDIGVATRQLAAHAFLGARLDEALSILAPLPLDDRSALSLRLSILVELGRAGELEQQIVTAARDTSIRFVFPRVLPAFLYALLGREADARAWFEPFAAADFAALRQDEWYRLMNLALLGETSVLLDDAQRAAVLYDLMLPFADFCIVPTSGYHCLGSAEYYLARLAATLGRWEVAEQHFTRALEANTRLGAPLFFARAQCAFADVLSRRAATGDHGRALELVEAAHSAARSLGLAALLRETTELRGRLLERR
jgi:hypothetical protein